jgi:hypothetical protein
MKKIVCNKNLSDIERGAIIESRATIDWSRTNIDWLSHI